MLGGAAFKDNAEAKTLGTITKMRAGSETGLEVRVRVGILGASEGWHVPGDSTGTRHLNQWGALN